MNTWAGRSLLVFVAVMVLWGAILIIKGNW